MKQYNGLADEDPFGDRRWAEQRKMKQVEEAKQILKKYRKLDESPYDINLGRKEDLK